MKHAVDFTLTDEQVRWIAYYQLGEDLAANPVLIKRFIRLAFEERLAAAKQHYIQYHPQEVEQEEEEDDDAQIHEHAPRTD